jgi:hypothetical protein
MTKKELIQSIKNEIKAISSILRENKKKFKYNQRVHSKAPVTKDRWGFDTKVITPSDYKALECYPFSKPWDGALEIEPDKFYFKGSFWNFNPDVNTAKCRLTCLHITYNMLRNKKLHCHSEERNSYYVQYYKSIMERATSYEEEKQDANVSSTSPA